jgi:raffinose/stachyose/melibiose transport system substrate-binding protein
VQPRYRYLKGEIKMKKGLLVVPLILALLSTSVFAQGAEESQAQKGKTTITLLDYFTPGEGAIPFRDVFKTYQDNNPNIVVDEETIASGDLMTKVKTLAVADELPDVFCLIGMDCKSFVENEKILPLTKYLDEDPAWKESFKDGVFSNFTQNGDIYGIPFKVTNTSVFYNDAIFEEVGIDEFPATWSELIDDCKLIRAAGYTPIEFGDKDRWNAESVIFSTLANRTTGNEWYESLRNRTGSKFTDPQFVLALTALSDLAKAGGFNSDINSIDGGQQREAFMQAKAAMTIEGSWGISEFDKNCPEDVLQHIQVAALPAVEGGLGDPTAISGGAGCAFAVNASIDEAKIPYVIDFLKSIVNERYATLQASIGTPTAVKPGDFELAENHVVAKRFNEFQKGRPYVPVYDHQLDSGLIAIMQEEFQNLFIDKITPEAFAEKLQAEYEKEN